MTLTGIGPFWLYQSILSFFSPTTKEKQDDETLTRIYICNYKTLLINRAGKHHRGFYLSSYPRNCSLLIFHHILDTLNIIHQSINLRGIFSLQLKHTNYSLLVLQFSLDKKRGVSCYQLVLDQFVCFDELSRQLCSKMLAHFASLLNWQSWQFLFHSLLSSCKNVQKHPMARAALYFGLTPSIFSCIPVGLTKHVHEYRIGSRSYWEPFGCSAVLLRSSNILATRTHLAILLTVTAIFG